MKTKFLVVRYWILFALPSTNKGRQEETQRVKAVLRENNDPMSFIHNCERALTTQPAENYFNGFVMLPYVKDVSEKIGHILKQQKVKVAYKPSITFFHTRKSFTILTARNQVFYTKSVSHSVILCTMAKQKGHLRPELWSTKRQWQVLTRPLKLQAMFTFSAII